MIVLQARPRSSGVLIAFSDQHGSDLGAISLRGKYQAVDALHLAVDALQGFGVAIDDQNLKCRRPGNSCDANVGRVDTHPVVLFGLPVGLSKLAGAGRAGHDVDALHDSGRRAVGEVEDQ